MRAWLKPLGYSDTINEAAIYFILREFVMSNVSSDSIMNMDMVVNILHPQLEHQTSYFSHQPSIVHTVDEMKAWLQAFGYSDAIKDATINAILREFAMSKVPSGSLCNADMISHYTAFTFSLEE